MTANASGSHGVRGYNRQKVWYPCDSWAPFVSVVQRFLEDEAAAMLEWDSEEPMTADASGSHGVRGYNHQKVQYPCDS